MSRSEVLAGVPSRIKRLDPLLILLLCLAQYAWLNFFYGSVSPSVSRDLESYQSSINGLANEPFDWDLLSTETIARRTLVYGEYLASIVFQITGALGGTAVELHTATITTLTLAAIFLQLNRRPVSSSVALLTLACPFMFSNLLLGNTRQLWGCIWTLIFYWRTPLFGYFSKAGVARHAIFTRAAFFFILILGTHVGSLLIFVGVLLIDYLTATFAQEGGSGLAKFQQHAGGLALAFLIAVAAYGLLGDTEALWRLQTKFDFYTSERGLHSYPYLTGGFFYLIILPLSLDVFYFMKDDPLARDLRFSMACIWILLAMTFVLPISHALDRVLTTLFLLAYIRRLPVGGMQMESLMVPARLGAAVFYILTR